MKLNEVFPSNFLKSDDLNDRDALATIATAEMEDIGNDRKLVLSFQGKSKRMICNKTNANRIAFLYGDDTDGWIGKEVDLTSEFVEFQGRTVKGLRIKPPGKKPNSGARVLENKGKYDTLKKADAVEDGNAEEIPW